MTSYERNPPFLRTLILYLRTTDKSPWSPIIFDFILFGPLSHKRSPSSPYLYNSNIICSNQDFLRSLFNFYTLIFSSFPRIHWVSPMSLYSTICSIVVHYVKYHTRSHSLLTLRVWIGSYIFPTARSIMYSTLHLRTKRPKTLMSLCCKRSRKWNDVYTKAIIPVVLCENILIKTRETFLG